LIIFASERKQRPGLLARERYRKSTSTDDACLKKVRETVLREPEDSYLADILAQKIEERLSYMYSPLSNQEVHRT